MGQPDTLPYLWLNMEEKPMILDNKNIFINDTALEHGMRAINIIKEKLKVIIVGVEFECDSNEAGRINSDKVMKPIVSCLLHDVQGLHHYRVDTLEKTIELKR